MIPKDKNSSNVILSQNSTVTRSAGIIDADIGGEVVAMNIQTGNCYGLNSVGSRIWNLISDPVRISGLCEKLQAEFEVAPEICESQVIKLLEELQAENMIVVFPER